MSYWDNSFQSTPSAWRETRSCWTRQSRYHISIHSLRMEGDVHAEPSAAVIVISIHSLRMEGDTFYVPEGI